MTPKELRTRLITIRGQLAVGRMDGANAGIAALLAELADELEPYPPTTSAPKEPLPDAVTPANAAAPYVGKSGYAPPIPAEHAAEAMLTTIHGVDWGNGQSYTVIASSRLDWVRTIFDATERIRTASSRLDLLRSGLDRLRESHDDQRRAVAVAERELAAARTELADFAERGGGVQVERDPRGEPGRVTVSDNG